MINIKQAVVAATKYIQDIYSPEELMELLLEEVELSEDEKYWLITLGFSRPKFTRFTNIAESFQSILGGKEYERVYKVIKVRSDTGEAIEMKIKQNG